MIFQTELAAQRNDDTTLPAPVEVPFIAFSRLGLAASIASPQNSRIDGVLDAWIPLGIANTLHCSLSSCAYVPGLCFVIRMLDIVLFLLDSHYS